MIQYKKILLTLALLLTAVTGAWAQEDPEGTPTVSVSDLKYEGGLYFYEVTATAKQAYGMDTEVKYTTDGTTPTSSSPAYTGPIKCYKNQTVKFQAFLMGTTIPGAAKDATITFSFEGPTISVDGAKVTISTNLNNATTYYKLNGGDAVEGTEVTLTQSATVTAYVVVTNGTYANFTSSESSKEVALQDESDAIEVTWDASTKTGTFTMPAFDVEIDPIYAPAAQWAKDKEVDQIPAAIEGIFAGTTDAIVKAGTVAKMGMTENPQGIVMYAVTTTNTTAPELSAFSPELPTAADIADEGADVLIWYYIQGANTPDGQEATAENTFNDSEICETPIKVTVLTNKFDIQFNAANANTIEAGKATVTVGGTAATVTDGKLQGVKMGSEVKVKAATGYKFRKVEVKKGVPVKTFNCAGVELIYEDGDTWAKVIERNPGKIYDDSGWIGRSDTNLFLIEGEELINGNQIITTDKIVDPTATYSWQAG